MAIDALPEPGQPGNAQDVFIAKMGAFLRALIVWTTQANALATDVAARQAVATAAATTATAAGNAALAVNAYKGNWSSLSGALVMPASVTHGGVWYALKANLADVTTQVPSAASAYWQPITYRDRVTVLVTTATQAITQDAGLYVLLYAGPIALTAPASPATDFAFRILPANGRADAVLLRNGNSFVGAGGTVTDDLLIDDAGLAWDFLCVGTNLLRVF